MIFNTSRVASRLVPILTFSLGSMGPLCAQQTTFDPYKPLQFSGSVPEYFRMPLRQQQESFASLLEQGKEEKAQKLVMGRINRGNYSLLSRFSEGEILFGDELSQYVNKVAAHIIKSNPKLPKNMQFYVTRAADVNAGTYAMGVILVNIGLLAQVSNEAELAAVICHEIAHYTLRHNVTEGYDSFDESQKKKARKQKYGDYIQEKVDRQFNRSKQHELEADSTGLLYFKNTGYEGAAVLSQFEMLHNSENSYGNLPVKLEAFTLDNIKLPSTFWLETIKVSAPFQEHSDRYYSHPNAGIRLACATRQLTQQGVSRSGHAFQVAKPEEFARLQDVARFEQLHLMLSTRQYGDVIYNSYVLSQKYPNNEYLESCMARAFCGLARYKNADALSDVARSYTQVEGESQRIHYMIKQFTRKQLNAYALKLVINTSRKYPKERLLDSLKSDLVRDMVVVNELKLEAFDDPGLKKDDLHVALLSKEVKDPALREMFKANYPLLQKKKDDDVKSASDREKEQLAREKMIRKNGPGIRAQKVLVESPRVAHLDKDGELSPEESELLRTNVMAALQSVSAKTQLPYAPTRGDGRDDAATFGRLALLNQCITESALHGSYDFRPLISDYVWPITDDSKTPLLYFTSYRYDQKTRKHKYASALYNLHTCRVVHYRLEDDSGEPTLKQLQAFMQEDFETIKR